MCLHACAATNNNNNNNGGGSSESSSASAHMHAIHHMACLWCMQRRESIAASLMLTSYFESLCTLQLCLTDLILLLTSSSGTCSYQQQQ